MDESTTEPFGQAQTFSTIAPGGTSSPASPPSRLPSLSPDDYRCEAEWTWFYISLALLILILLIFAIVSFGTFLLLLPVLAAVALWQMVSMVNSKLGRCLAVSARQMPEVHRSAVVAAERLAMDLPPVFVEQKYEFNASSSALLNRKCIVLTSALVENLSEDELTFVLGHELSHIKCKHTLWTIISGSAGNFQVPWLSPILGKVFQPWSRMAELTADRGGLIACQSESTAVSCIVKLTVGAQLAKKVVLDEFLKQRVSRDKFGQWYDVLETDHPAQVDRVHQLQAFADSDQYRRLIHRNDPERLKSVPPPFPTTNADPTLRFAGYACAVLAILICPPAFSGVGFYLGLKLEKRGDKRHGERIKYLSLGLGLVGMVLWLFLLVFGDPGQS